MSEVAQSDESQTLRAAPLPNRSAMVRGLVGFVMIGAFLPSLLGLAGRFGWLLDLCNHFRFQCLLVLLLTTAGLMLLRSWRMGLVSLAGVAINAAFVLPLYLGTPGPSVNTDPVLTVMHFNVNTANRDRAGVIQAIQASGADLVFIQEVNPPWLDALKAGLSAYKLVAAEPRTDNFGIACFVRQTEGRRPPISVTSSRVFDPTAGKSQVPAIECVCDVDGQTVAILSIHPLPPISVVYAQARNATLAAAGEWARSQDTPHIVVGDFNATPWSSAFRDLQSTGGLVNSQVGFGRAPTWPDGLGSLGMIPIDHLLHSRELVTIDRRIGRAHGSDHRPLTVELGWRTSK